jgi:hypothetical protein
MRLRLVLCTVAVVAVLHPAPADARRNGLIGFRPLQSPLYSPHVFRPGVIPHSYGPNAVRPPYWPDVCSVTRHGPCLPQYDYPIGQDLRLTIGTAEAETKAPPTDAAPDAKPAPEAKAPDDKPETPPAEGERKLDTIRDLFAALRACWTPPPEDEARPGMQMSVRFSFKTNGQIIAAPRVTYKSPDAPLETIEIYRKAIMDSLDHCTPLQFTSGLGGAIAGRPIAIRFVDDRTK